MTAQMSLPGFDHAEADDPQPDPLAEARAELAGIEARWQAAQARYRASGRNAADFPAIALLQPIRRAAMVRVDRLESGPRWWH